LLNIRGLTFAWPDDIRGLAARNFQRLYARIEQMAIFVIALCLQPIQGFDRASRGCKNKLYKYWKLIVCCDVVLACQQWLALIVIGLECKVSPEGADEIGDTKDNNHRTGQPDCREGCDRDKEKNAGKH
jgi:uncharacterized membrane protein